jgi:hypothetical protein
MLFDVSRTFPEAFSLRDNEELTESATLGFLAEELFDSLK